MQDFDLEYFEANAILFADSSRGIYIPQHFAETLAADARVVYDENLDEWERIKPILLEGPNHPEYWDVWETTIDYAKVHHGRTVYSMWQDDDLFILPEAN
jgi:hypothetical protein